MPSERQPVRFGIFEVNLETGEVRRAGVKVKLQEQPFQVLAALLEKPGEIVTKEELQERIWKDDTFVDFDRSLATAINKVRQALDDSALRPRFIETVAKRGYRFIGANIDLGTAPSASVESPPPDRLRVRVLSIALGLSLLALLAATLTRTPAEMSERLVRRFSIAPEGLYGVSISPDGKYLAYRAAVGGRNSLWVRSLETENSRELAGTVGVSGGFFWSPDSSALGFALGANSSLNRIAIAGGGPLRVCELPGKSESSDSFAGGSFSPDGKRIVFSSGLRLYGVAAEGGQPELLLDRGDDLRSGAVNPRFLPSGEGPPAIVYTALASMGSRDQWLAVFNLETGERRELGPGSAAVYSAEGYLVRGSTDHGVPGLWALPFSLATLETTGEGFPISERGLQASLSRDGTLAFLDPGMEMGLKTLVWRSRTGEITQKVGQPQAGLREFSLSPDRQWVLATVAEPSDIWMQDLTRATATRLTFDPAYEFLPSWTPSGNEFTYTLATGGGRPSRLMRKSVDGTGEPAPLVQSDHAGSPADWSRDGRYVVFPGVSDAGTSTDILYAELKASGGPYKPQVFLSTPARERVPKLSADGRFIAYVSDESGRPEVYVRSFPDGAGRRQASSDGGTQPRWRDDGKELFYVENDQSLMAVPVSIGQELTLGPPKRLFDSQDLRFRDNPWPQYDVSADGQSFLTATPADGAALPTIRLVENWYEEFRDREE